MLGATLRIGRSLADAVVVGAGPNGLAAAITLARAGRSVKVIECAEEIGGGTRTAELTLPGFRHDVCAAVHPLAVASPFLSSLGLERHGLRFAYADLEAAHPLDDGSAVALHRSLEATASTLGVDARAYESLMAPFQAGWPALSRFVLGPPLGGLPRDPLLVARFAAVGVRPARWFARGRFAGERARALFAGMAAHSIQPLGAPGTSAFALVLMALGHAVRWPVASGGSASISSALLAELVALGARIQTGREVRSLRDGDDLVAAKAILFDVSPRSLLAICDSPDDLPRWYRGLLSRFRYGPGVFKVDYALSGPVPWRAPECRVAGTVHLGGRLDEIAASEAAVARGRHPERPYVLVAQQSLVDRTRVPQEAADSAAQTLWAYCHVPNGSSVDMTAAIEAQIERFAPGFRDLVLARATRTAASYETYDPNYVGGDINGGAASLWQTLARPAPSPVPYATPNPRVFLCSASTPPGGGVHGMCGHNAARAALRRALR